MMAQDWTTFVFIIINVVLFSFVSFSSCHIHEQLLDHDHIQEEFEYDFPAYPSYTCTVNNADGPSSFSKLQSVARDINVDSFGAKGDVTHDTKAFEDAWREACSSTVAVNFVVPQGKQYLLKPLTFSGPCKSQIVMQIHGALKSSDNMSDYSKDTAHWIRFEGIQNLIVEGGGTINGKGNIWWQNSCKINKSLPCKKAPTAITFHNSQNLIVQNLQIQDAQQIHVSFERCVNVQASHLVVKAPEKSPNTDGIHVSNTQNIQISNCTIGTGDDCISIGSGSEKVQVTGITCGPGHGISIGSLGEGNSGAYVSDVIVNGARLFDTSNGVRIKTWQGGSGSASNIRFQNVEMLNVENPIIVDQYYCDHPTPCKEQHSAVQVRNVMYENIKGTSASEVAINIDCSKSFPCQEMVLQNVDLVGVGGRAAKASCNNVNLSNIGPVTPHCP